MPASQHSRAEFPLVSVCISAYNHERYVGEAIDSILAQDYPNLELVIVDDASTDTSAAIIEGYAKRYPKLITAILLSENEGPSRAGNRAYAAAKGEFVAFLGTDDRMLPNRIKRQVDFLIGNPGCVAVFSDVAIIDGDGKRVLRPEFETLFNQPVSNVRRQLLTGNFLNAPSALLRRVDLMAAGGSAPLLRYVQDYELWVRLLQRGEIAKLPETLVEYRVHGANLSIFGSEGPSFAARCETVSVIVQLVRESPLESLLERPLVSPQDRVSALLELVELLKRVDRHYFGKPSLASAYAYALILEASRIDAAACVASKAELEVCLEGGFEQGGSPQDQGDFVWFGSCLVAEGQVGEVPFTVKGWVDARVTTPVQNRLVKEYLGARRARVLRPVILDMDGDESKVLTTLNSLNQAGSIPIAPVLLSTASHTIDHETSVPFLSVTPETWVNVLNQVVSSGGFDWLMLLEAGATFLQSGLTSVHIELAAADQLQAIYADELLDGGEGDLGALFRPSFNLDLLLSLPSAMAKHWLFSRDSLDALGGFNEGFPEAVELELITRLIEQYGIAGIGHIDEPLLISSATSLQDIVDERLVIERHLQRRGYGDACLLQYSPGRYRLNYGHAQTPLVSIIVPTKDQLPMLLRCVTSLLEKTSYPNYELLIVDNNSETPEALSWLDGVAQMDASKVRVLRYPHPFNYSAINNMAAREARGEYLILLNNDTAVIQEDWLENLLNHGQRPEVGIVGAKLFYPDGRIQHAGVVLGLRGPSEHPFCGAQGDESGYMQRMEVDQNYTAVTAACMLIRKSIYMEVGGLDEEAFRVSYNDVDLCLKVREAGYLTVWTPHARLVHEGSVSQTTVDVQTYEIKRKRFLGEQDALYAKWLPLIARDPAYNANLSLNGAGFEVESDIDLTWRPLSWRPLPVVMAHMGDMTGCGHYRIIKPFNAMEEGGLVDGKLSQVMLELPDFARYAPDSIVMQRQLSEHFHDWIQRIKALTNTFKVYELDDYLPNLPLKSVHRNSFSKDVVKSLRKSLGFVDRFVVSTEPLAEALEGMHPDIRVTQNRLPLDWWGGLSSQRRQGRKPRVGWAGGSGHTGDLELIIDVVKDLANEVEWVFFGMCPDRLLPYVHEFHHGVHIDLYPAKLASLNLDLALAPLEDNLFNRCKSNLRLLEYGICGFPVICSDMQPYRCDLPVARVKNRYRDWVDAIRAHLSDLDGAAAQGDALQARVRNEWMLEGDNLLAWRDAWLPD
jgi:glycosyltransferase involved in cell wall biosynthesis